MNPKRGNNIQIINRTFCSKSRSIICDWHFCFHICKDAFFFFQIFSNSRHLFDKNLFLRSLVQMEKEIARLNNQLLCPLNSSRQCNTCNSIHTFTRHLMSVQSRILLTKHFEKWQQCETTNMSGPMIVASRGSGCKRHLQFANSTHQLRNKSQLRTWSPSSRVWF